MLGSQAQVLMPKSYPQPLFLSLEISTLSNVHILYFSTRGENVYHTVEPVFDVYRLALTL